jgi:hypothetical protein
MGDVRVPTPCSTGRSGRAPDQDAPRVMGLNTLRGVSAVAVAVPRADAPVAGAQPGHRHASLWALRAGTAKERGALLAIPCKRSAGRSSSRVSLADLCAGASGCGRRSPQAAAATKSPGLATCARPVTKTLLMSSSTLWRTHGVRTKVLEGSTDRAPRAPGHRSSSPSPGMRSRSVAS